MKLRGSKVPRNLIRVIMSALRALDTPFSLGIHLLVEREEWDSLAELSLSPLRYLDTPSGVERYRRDAQAAALVRKVPWPTSFSRKKAAEQTFEQCERKCAETNYVLDWVTTGLCPKDVTLNAMRGILAKAKKFASYVLGPLPDQLIGRSGPGTVFELKGSPQSTLADKVCITPHVTREAEAIFRFCFDGSLWDRERLRVGLPFVAYSRGNRFTTVPKDGKTDRGICVEPGGNIWCQLAVGDVMKERLKRVGLDVARKRHPQDPIELLRRRIAGAREGTGQDTHRRLAEMASRDGHLSTIDLSNASDTVARNLVEAILPDDWLQLLSSLRSPFTLLGKRWVKLEKFSSMGNGFTFELETLIFSALIAGTTDLEVGRDFWVYGDDIIVPSGAFKDVCACLRAFGFEPNPKKSFSTGLFRESCGGDFFAGQDVRPYFISVMPSSPLDWMELYNGLRRVGLGSRFIRSVCCDEIPSRLRVFGPPNTNTIHVSDKSLWSTVTKRSITWLSTLVPIPLRIPLDRWDSWCHYTLALMSVSSEGVSPPRSIAGYRLTKVSVS
jgi:hypothetical protein